MEIYNVQKDSILRKYRYNIYRLPSRKRLHLVIRLYRISGQKIYKKLFISEFEDRYMGKREKFQNTILLKEAKVQGKKMLSVRSNISDRSERKMLLYKKYPELFYYKQLLLFLFIAKSSGYENNKNFTVTFKRSLKIIKGLNIKDLFLSDYVIQITPSFAANAIYTMKYLGVNNYEKEIVGKIKDCWMERIPRNQDEWKDKIYAFTHLIIGASNYYQNFVSKRKFGWILKLFEDNLDEIIKQTNADVQAEVGVCFMLCKDYKNPVLDRIRKQVSLSYNPKKGYISYKGISSDNLESAEHRNILAVILFSDLKQLFSGPHLGAD